MAMEEDMAVVTPASPKQVLMAATASIPEFVLQTVNQLLTEVVVTTYPGDMQLIILESALALRLEEVAHERGVTLTDEMWKKFPYLYADKWDILVPFYGPGQQPHYVFSPKGVRRMKAEDVDGYRILSL